MFFSFNSSYFKLCHTTAVYINEEDAFPSWVFSIVWSTLAVTQEIREGRGKA